MVKMKNILILCFFLGTISSHYSFGTFLNSWLKKGIAIGVVIVSASFLLWYLAKQGNVDQESEVKIEDPTEEDKKSIIDTVNSCSQSDYRYFSVNSLFNIPQICPPGQ